MAMTWASSAAAIFVRHTFATFDADGRTGRQHRAGRSDDRGDGGAVADRIGRRATLVWAGYLYSWLGSRAVAPNVGVLIVARAIIGIAIGFTSVTAPVYVSELAPPQSRGMLIGLYQFALTSGSPWRICVGYWLATQQAWRLMFGLAAVPTVFFLAVHPDRS